MTRIRYDGLGHRLVIEGNVVFERGGEGDLSPEIVERLRGQSRIRFTVVEEEPEPVSVHVSAFDAGGLLPPGRSRIENTNEEVEPAAGHGEGRANHEPQED